MALRLLLIINCCLLQKEELLQDRILFVDSSHNFFWLLLMQSWSKCSKNWTFRSCFTSSELFLPFSFQQDTVLGSIESVTPTYSVPHIHLPASLQSGTVELHLDNQKTPFYLETAPYPCVIYVMWIGMKIKAQFPKKTCYLILFVEVYLCLLVSVYFNIHLAETNFKQKCFLMLS